MKNFDNFLKLLTPEKIGDIVDNANDALENSREEFSRDPRTNLGNQIATTSLFISLGLLEEYHEWLHSKDD